MGARLALLASILFGLAAEAAADAVFNVNLNVNYYTDATADRVPPAIRRHAALMQRYGLRADYCFTWLAARMVAERDPSLFADLEAAGMGVVHHGANRPPDPSPVDRIQGMAWDQAVSTLRDYESHDLDPSSGALLPGVGGLLGLRQLYGIVPLATGRFVKAPVLYVALEHGVKGMVGLQSNVGAPTAQAWFMGALDRPEDPDLTLEPDSFDPRDGTAGAAAAAEIARRLDGLGPGTHFGALLIHDSELVGGSIQEMRASGASEGRSEAYWDAYERLVALLASRRDVRVLTIRQIHDAAAADLAPTLSGAEVKALASTLRAASSLPLAPDAGGRSVTLAEALSALESVVAAGAIPAATPTRSLLGPRADAPGSGPVTVARADLVRAAGSGAGHDGDFVRSSVTIGGRTLDAAEYLVALASLVAQDFPSEVRVEARGLFPERTSATRDTLTRLQFWTYKPARFEW